MIFANTTAQVLFPDGDTDFIGILDRVLQVDTLAPYLFLIALDYAMRQAVGNESNLGFTLNRSRSRWHPAKLICDTHFADDIALLSNTLEQTQLLLSRVEHLQSRLDSIYIIPKRNILSSIKVKETSRRQTLICKECWRLPLSGIVDRLLL